MKNDIKNITRAIFRAHGCTATRLRTALIDERFKGKRVWRGSVEVFAVQHPEATQCYGWTYKKAGRVTHVAILGKSPVASPLDAVRAFIVSQSRQP